MRFVNDPAPESAGSSRLVIKKGKGGCFKCLFR